MARNVKPMPRPPTSTHGRSRARIRRHVKVANASSDPCMRLDMRLRPAARMTYSLSRRVSVISVPSGVRVWPNSSQGFTPDTFPHSRNGGILAMTGLFGGCVPCVLFLETLMNHDGDRCDSGPEELPDPAAACSRQAISALDNAAPRKPRAVIDRVTQYCAEGECERRGVPADRARDRGHGRRGGGGRFLNTAGAEIVFRARPRPSI